MVSVTVSITAKDITSTTARGAPPPLARARRLGFASLPSSASREPRALLLLDRRGGYLYISGLASTFPGRKSGHAGRRSPASSLQLLQRMADRSRIPYRHCAGGSADRPRAPRHAIRGDAGAGGDLRA